MASVKVGSNDCFIFNKHQTDYVISPYYFTPERGFYDFVESKVYGDVCVIVLSKSNAEEKKAISASAKKTSRAVAPLKEDTRVKCTKNVDHYQFTLQPDQLKTKNILHYGLLLEETNKAFGDCYRLPDIKGTIVCDGKSYPYLLPAMVNASLGGYNSPSLPERSLGLSSDSVAGASSSPPPHAFSPASTTSGQGATIKVTKEGTGKKKTCYVC